MFINIKSLKFASLACLAALTLSACTPTTATRGHIVEDVELADIQAGRDTQRSVIKKIGSPTAISSLDSNTWYYIGMTTEKRGILDPEEKNKKVVQITFTDEGKVEKVENIQKASLDIPISQDKTHTGGNQITLMQQFFGNLGKFNTPQQ